MRPRVTGGRGVTLIEVLVAGVLLLLLTGLLYASLRSTVSAAVKSDKASDAYRACVLAQTHLRQMLRGARVVSLGDGTTLEFQTLMRDPSGNPVVTDSTGEPAWSATNSRVYLDAQGRLMLDDGTTRILARLGNQAEIFFTQPSPTVLKVNILAQNTEREHDASRNNRYRSSVEIFLPNQLP